MLEGPSPPFLLDVREPYEWAIGNLGSQGAFFLPIPPWISGRSTAIHKSRLLRDTLGGKTPSRDAPRSRGGFHHRIGGQCPLEAAGSLEAGAFAPAEGVNSDFTFRRDTPWAFATMKSATRAHTTQAGAPHRAEDSDPGSRPKASPPAGSPGHSPGSCTLRQPMGCTKSRSTEDIIHGMALQQHGVVTRTQLLAAGVSRRSVDGRLRANRLRPLHRGVYLVGPLLPGRGREMAAALACGAGAVVSHRSAAVLWELLPPVGDSCPVDVTVQGRDGGRRKGIRPHKVPDLKPEDVAAVHGIPVTTPVRTIVDLASAVSARELEQALAQAERRQLVTLEELRVLVDRRPGRTGTPALRALLQHHGSPAPTRSEAEERYLALIRRAKLPTPEANVVLGGHELDFLWRSEGIAVEVDGFAFHSSRSQFERDRRRDAELLAGGIQVIRVTWRQIEAEPYAVLACLAQALARAGLRTR
jgi:very-short-patch-repair endonuclease